MDTRSTLTRDVEDSIRKAYDSSLNRQDQADVRKHLAFVLTQLYEPNSLIEPVKQALEAIDRRVQPWHERPLGVVGITIVGGLVVAGLAKLFHWV